MRGAAITITLLLVHLSLATGASLSAASATLSVARADSVHEPLIICNAFPAKDAVTVSLNSEHLSTSSLSYKECRGFSVTPKVGDVVSMHFDGNQGLLGGSFKVSALPPEKDTLLLVFERHDSKTRTPSFQSFAFPTSSASAQVAVIDAFKGPSQQGNHLKMTDHVATPTSKESARVETLAFNRVYEVESGRYDVAFDELEATVRTLGLEAGQDYVILRTGGEDKSLGSFGESLVVYPPTASLFAHSSATSLTVSATLLAVVAAVRI